MKALVVYGSKLGGTEGLADMIGQALTEQQWQVTVRSAAVKKSDVGAYDAVVIGGGACTPAAGTRTRDGS